MSFLGFFSFLTVTLVTSLKCPESRKSHATNCTMFYNCVDLPNGEHAWVPAKCNDGLIFEPYLQMCVLPENSNSCDTRTETPEIIKNTDHQYSTAVESSWYMDSGISSDKDQFSEQLDFSYLLNDEDNAKVENKNENIGYRLKNVLSEENNLYEFIEKCQNTAAFLNNEIQEKIYSTFLNNLINRMLVHCNSNKRPNSKFIISKIIPELRNVKESKTETDYCDTIILKCLSIKNNAQKDYKRPIFDESKTDNSIISITDNLGNKQYISTNKYLSLRDKLKVESVHVITCIERIRLPNVTDCTKYYTCDLRTASVTEFSCPTNTAFNEQTRKCDIKSYKICSTHKSFSEVPTASLTNNESAFESSLIIQRNECHSVGKIADPSSIKHYYLCYSNAENSSISSIRLACPKYLIFCRKTNACTTEYLCK